MPTRTVEITRRVEFSASHRLHNPELTEQENRELFGVCNNLHGHGHNYELEVCVAGDVPRETGMVMDLNRLSVLLDEEVVGALDHKHLNHDVPFLQGIIPTAENIAICIWDRIAPRIEDYRGCRLHRITLYESRNNYVVYRGPRA